MASSADWLSAVFSGVAAVAAIVTLLTVYAAAISILSRREAYRLGVSRNALGEWEKTVVRPSLWRMRTQISTPTLNLSKLVALEPKWRPNLTFPLGISPEPKKPSFWRSIIASVTNPAKMPITNPEGSKVLAEASWVNFLEGLSITPEDKGCYEMQNQSELVNGIVPMRWKGKDLAGICSMLGFQCPGTPDSKAPMPLPIQWSGPFGWLQFRASADGCVVEYRRRSVRNNHLHQDSHDYYLQPGFVGQPLRLETRLWQSMGGFCLPDGELLYIGGADKRLSGNDCTEERRSTERICREVMETPDDLTDEQLMGMFWGKTSTRPAALRPDVVLLGPTQSGKIPEKNTNQCDLLAVLNLCPGLLSVVMEGELADGRGIDLRVRTCHEFRTTYTDPDDYNSNQSEHPHRLGRLRMTEEALKLVKNAVHMIRPDGYYFTPDPHLMSNSLSIWSSVEAWSNKLKQQIFPTEKILDWKSDSRKPKDVPVVLYHAMSLCNQFQHIKRMARADFTIADMSIVSRASKSLLEIVAPSGALTGPGVDLIWAMLASPPLFTDLAVRFAALAAGDLVKLNVTVTCVKGEIDGGFLGLGGDRDADGVAERGREGLYVVPLCEIESFTGTQLLAAFLDVFLSYFWIQHGWLTNVSLMDTTMPQSVTMC